MRTFFIFLALASIILAGVVAYADPTPLTYSEFLAIQ